MRSASSSISVRIVRFGQKNPHRDAHPGQRVFRVKNVARIGGINVLD